MNFARKTGVFPKDYLNEKGILARRWLVHRTILEEIAP
jgi:hypothetical protein